MSRSTSVDFSLIPVAGAGGGAASGSNGNKTEGAPVAELRSLGNNFELDRQSKRLKVDNLQVSSSSSSEGASSSSLALLVEAASSLSRQDQNNKNFSDILSATRVRYLIFSFRGKEEPAACLVNKKMYSLGKIYFGDTLYSCDQIQLMRALDLYLRNQINLKIPRELLRHCQSGLEDIESMFKCPDPSFFNFMPPPVMSSSIKKKF